MKEIKEDRKYTGFNRAVKSNSIQTILDKIDDGTFRDFFGDWKWIFSFSKKYRWIIVFYTLLGIASSSLSIAASYLSKIVINIIVEKQREDLWILIVSMVASTVLSIVVSSVTSRISTKISLYVNNDIQDSIFAKIVDCDWMKLNAYSKGDLLHRFSSDVSTVANNAIGWIPNLIINLYTFAATFIVLFRIDRIMAWIALGSAPFLIIMSRFIMRRMREYKKRVLELRSDMMAFEVETFYNIDAVKSFGITDRYRRTLRSWQAKRKEYSLDYNKFEIKSKIAMKLVSALVTMGAFGYCLFRLWTGQILYGDMTFFLTQRKNLTSKFSNLVSTVPGMVSSAISAHRIRELVELPKEKHDASSVETVAASADEGITVSMNDVSFSYTEGKNVYEHGDLTVRPGEIVAILGPSGEGKTTMLRLLLGLIYPSRGSVTLTTIEGNSVDMNADLRQFFAYVPQGNSIFSGTVADNLRMVNESATDDELIEALKQSCAWEFVSELPDTINYKLGEKGSGLSEGQAQRIAIARAILRNAPVLLLDEATSALDMDTEARVLQNIIRAYPNRCCIVSTHRPSVLKQCTRVYRITGSTVEEQNTEE